MSFVIIIILGIVGWGIVEYLFYQRRLKSIPVRILVNGSRGKSSVTRLIAAGLRSGEISVFAKTTGTEACIIDEAGSDHPILRITSPTISEQIGVLRQLKRFRPDALIVECMAIQPKFQWIMEHRMLKSTIGVITNSRMDHVNEMGPLPEQISQSLANSIPRNGTLFTSDRKALPIFREIAESRGTVTTLADIENVSKSEMQGFPFIEHRSNVALALGVCKHLNIEREDALRAMQKTKPDSGVLRKIGIEYEGKKIKFVNGFAANDPESTLMIWNQIDKSEKRDVLILLNSRIDRFARSKQLVDLFAENMLDSKLILIGGRTAALKKRAVQRGVDKKDVFDFSGLDCENVCGKILNMTDSDALIFGIGNMGGGGAEIVACFDKISKQTQSGTRR